MIIYKSNDVTIRESELDDVHALKYRLRDEDAKEVLSSGFRSVEDALAYSYFKSSIRLTVEFRGVPVGMFGIVPETLLGSSANVWFLGAEEMSKIKKTFVKLSRRFIADFLLKYPVLFNIVDGRYTTAISWLKSCGAIFEKEPVMSNGVEFYKFTLGRS